MFWWDTAKSDKCDFSSSSLLSTFSRFPKKLLKLLSSLLDVVVVSFPIILSPTLPLVILSHQTDSFWGGRNVWKENSVGVVLRSMWKKGKKKKKEKGSHTSDEALRLSRIHQLSCFQFRLTTPFLLLFCPLVGERENKLFAVSTEWLCIINFCGMTLDGDEDESRRKEERERFSYSQIFPERKLFPSPLTLRGIHRRRHASRESDVISIYRRKKD